MTKQDAALDRALTTLFIGAMNANNHVPPPEAAVGRTIDVMLLRNRL